MREILFRGKTYDGKWEQGDLRHGGYVHNDSETYIMRSDYALHNIPVDPKTVGQFTGLTDKNKAKIFEGDIVRCYDENLDDEFYAVVEFGNPNGAYNWGFQLRPIAKASFNIDILLWVEMEETGATIEVIGNIYDNAELLKGGSNG